MVIINFMLHLKCNRSFITYLLQLHELHDNLLNMSPKPLNLVNLGKEFDVIIQSIQNSTEIWGNIIGEYNSVRFILKSIKFIQIQIFFMYAYKFLKILS